jgi:hypothetical protein
MGDSLARQFHLLFVPCHRQHSWAVNRGEGLIVATADVYEHKLFTTASQAVEFGSRTVDDIFFSVKAPTDLLETTFSA